MPRASCVFFYKSCLTSIDEGFYLLFILFWMTVDTLVDTGTSCLYRSTGTSCLNRSIGLPVFCAV